MAENEKGVHVGSAPVQDPKKGHDPRIARFTASVLLLSTIGLSQLISQRLASGGALPVAQLLFLIFCAFTHEWNLVHGEGLTRHRRAYFDIVNVLETYQTRARTHGHLFQPDPPTPMVTFAGEGNQPGMTHEASTEKTDFTNARDAHYANMFQIAMKMNKEIEMMEKAEKEQAEKEQAEKAQQSQQKVSSQESPSSSQTGKPASKDGSKKSSKKAKARKKGSSKKSSSKKSKKANVVKM
ncbi:hypothetical protein RB195_001782 [Necator americanus]